MVVLLLKAGVVGTTEGLPDHEARATFNAGLLSWLDKSRWYDLGVVQDLQV